MSKTPSTPTVKTGCEQYVESFNGLHTCKACDQSLEQHGEEPKPASSPAWTPGPWRVGRLMEEMAPRPDGMTPEQGATWDRLMAERNQYRRDNDGAFVVLAGTMATDDLKRVGAATFQGTAKRGQAHAASDPEGLANARLIAAAPELYAALEFVRDQLGHGQDCAYRQHSAAECTCYIVDIEVALAEARGA